jgi:RNA polymerase sigma-70 factor (TIGR02960 family)
MTDSTLTLARAGDEQAFRELTEPYRRELQLHCYRIVGSTQDAEDLVQETLLAAWRGLDGFAEQASVRTWLYRIATNRSLDALRASARRPQSQATMTEPPTPTRLAESIWLEPYPDVLIEGIIDQRPGPEARYEQREAAALAFVAGLQHIPPQQRAVLVLRDVLSFRAAEAAEILNTSEAAVNSLLRRARAALESRLPATARERAPLPNSARERQLVGQFSIALEDGDVDAIVELLTDDAWVTMPPQPYEYQGAEAIARFLRDRAQRRGSPLRIVPTRANGQPAFGCYLPCPQTEIARPYGLMVLTLAGSRIAEITFFGDSSVFPHFGLPRTLRTSHR